MLTPTINCLDLNYYILHGVLLLFLSGLSLLSDRMRFTVSTLDLCICILACLVYRFSWEDEYDN